MSDVSATFEDLVDSLTGFDEIAISQQFGRTISALTTSDESMAARALVFTAKRRGGMPDDEAKRVAFEMPLREVLAFFESETQESGKDEQSSEMELVSLQRSAS